MNAHRNRKSVLLAVAFVLLMLAVVVLTACGSPAPTPVPTSAPPTTAPVATTASVATTAPAATKAPATSAPAATTAPTTAPTTAATVKPDFGYYNGKTVTFIVATKAGGGYDAYARAVAPYLQKYLPGSTVIIKNVPGAGHIIGANETYASKPDGLTIGTFNTGLIYSQLIGAEGMKFDLTKFTWIAKMSSDNRVLMVSTKSPYKTFDDVLKSSKPIVLSSAGVASASQTDAEMLAKALGFKVKMISGYQGNDSDLAMLRGEVDGTVGSYSSLLHFVDEGDGRILLQVGAKKVPGLDAPLASDLAKGDGEPIVAILTANASLGRLVAAPPGVPPERREALIEAFQKAMVDPDYVAFMKKGQLPVDPAYGDEVDNLIKHALNVSPSVLTQIKDILSAAAGG